MGEAGLLNGREVSTAWLYAGDIAALYPDPRLKPGAILLEDGAVTTTDAVSSVFDLAICLNKRRFGAGAATATAHVAVHPRERASQAPDVDTHLLERRVPTFSQNPRQWFEARLAQG
jgi:transcriptional regulator GlxA family with amidase domain